MSKIIAQKLSTQIFLLIISAFLVFHLFACTSIPQTVRISELFTKNWKFMPGDDPGAFKINYNDSDWRVLNLPHDWSIEGEFSKDHPATPGGGALPGGTGWYRKSFKMPESRSGKMTFIKFDGIYRNSEVWINGNYLGKRPYGYISFIYELTPYLKYGDEENIIAVKVDNSKQPNSRWYSGSGIYRNVHLITTDKIHVDKWGTFVTTPDVNNERAVVLINTTIQNFSDKDEDVVLRSIVIDESGEKVSEIQSSLPLLKKERKEVPHKLIVESPILWSDKSPYLYKVLTFVECNGEVRDNYETPLGIRFFDFDTEKGFLLNGERVKIKGVCNHHDLGCLGTAVNKRAIERQLEILKEMGCNGIRTSHNPPAPELLDLCDKMGFIVMNEAFDIWAVKKSEYDYALDWYEWHEKDMRDFVIRDRNHPSVFMWSIGNEVMEQWGKDSSGIVITRELTSIVKSLDPTRPVTAGCNGTEPSNPLFRAEVLDIIGFNYHLENFLKVPEEFPGKPFIATETESSLHTRGYYDMPSDSIRRWPLRWDIPFNEGNPDYTCSSYDNCCTPWGSTHEETWSLVKKYDFISGMYTWTGFDYLGEPTPYSWPARSSYFGIIDLAGFPKDAFYMYKSEWTDEPVLHVFPHWNWKKGEEVDVWVYTSCDEVELFLNGNSLGIKKKGEDKFHLMWRLNYQQGVIRAEGINTGKVELIKEVRTAAEPYRLQLQADRNEINADGLDLSFITVKVLDDAGNLVPYAENLINFNVKGMGKLAGVDNGLQTSHEPFKADYRKAFNGLCLAVIQAGEEKGEITLKADSEGLEGSEIVIQVK
ncbi:MAG: glycoside hydrolase family 2 protein [Melioribacteraceae bacterium]|nr:glycoside hydrolase family 2 protein [Melioribacteraceae bacterium]